MFFTSVGTALLAAANFAVATPVQSEGGVLTTLNTRQQWGSPTCVQGLITPYSKTDLENMRTWFLTQSSDDNDFIGARGWYTWTLGSTRICIFNTNPNGTKDENVNHKAHAQCLAQIRDTCCSPTTDQCRAGRAPEYSVAGAELACRVSAESTSCQ